MDELLATETLKLLNGYSKMHMLGLGTCAMKKMLYLMPGIKVNVFSYSKTSTHTCKISYFPPNSLANKLIIS